VGGAIKLMDSYGLIPPDHQGILGVGKTLTYASQRLLTSGQSLAREFPSSRISKVHPVNGLPPKMRPTATGLRTALTVGACPWTDWLRALCRFPSTI
jgi:hypothetical protein